MPNLLASVRKRLNCIEKSTTASYAKQGVMEAICCRDLGTSIVMHCKSRDIYTSIYHV